MGWPFYISLALLILGTVFLFAFRPEIRQLLQGIRRIDKSGLTISANQKESQAERDPRAEADALMRQFDSALLRETEDRVSEELGQRNLSGAEAVPVLIRHYASVLIAFQFEQVYRIIWGSQLSLIQYINTSPGQPTEAVRAFYNIAASTYPAWYQGYSFERWLGFVKDQLLLREDRGLVNITVRGREFLLYLTRSGYPTEKAG